MVSDMLLLTTKAETKNREERFEMTEMMQTMALSFMSACHEAHNIV